MARRVQVTLTGNEGKLLIAKAAAQMSQVQKALEGHKLLLCGGTTVSALSEELGYEPLRMSGRIESTGTRTALQISEAPHNILIEKRESRNADKDIQSIMEKMDSDDLIVVGANAIDTTGRAALAFAALGGGSRGHALHNAYMQGVPMLILAGLNKLIPDLGSAQANCGRTGIDRSMGAAIALFNLYGKIITEIKAFEVLFGIEAVVIAGSGTQSGEGSRTFVLSGEEDAIEKAWDLCLSMKGAGLSADKESLVTCIGGCRHCLRHQGCYYKMKAMGEE